MGIGAAQIGLDHQRRDGFGVGGRQAGRLERALGEGDKLRRGDARHGGRLWLGSSLARPWVPLPGVVIYDEVIDRRQGRR